MVSLILGNFDWHCVLGRQLLSLSVEQIWYKYFNKIGTDLLGLEFEDLRVAFPTLLLPEFVETLNQLFSRCMTLKRSGICIGYGVPVDLDEFLHHLHKSVGGTDVLGLC